MKHKWQKDVKYKGDFQEKSLCFNCGCIRLKYFAFGRQYFEYQRSGFCSQRASAFPCITKEEEIKLIKK